MKNLPMDRINALRYTDAVRDRNEIHQSDKGAFKYGLEGAIVPGMWLVSHIQSRSDISQIKQIKFAGNVHYGEEILMEETQSRRGSDFNFKRGDEVVCSVNGVRVGDYSPSVKALDNIIHSYSADVCPERIGLFLSSIGFRSEIGDSPEMYLASLSAPALLDYGAQSGLVGVHATQSFNMHQGYKPGVVNVLIGDKKEKGPLNFLDLRWVQEGKIIASGRAGVMSL